MAKIKSTKRALLASGLALLMCVSMLVGSTFAWFTDSVTSAGNTIQSGTLNVDLVDAYDVSLAGKVLEFVDQDDNDLWEPGCTYTLQEVYVANMGNLALKYEIAINGITGDAKLLEAIEWTVTMGGVTKTLNELNGFLLPETKSEAIVISGHMKEDAGNDYQGLTVDGISISVFATQYTHEFDSIDNQYDDIAFVSDADALKAAIAEGKNVMLTNDVALDVNGKAMTVAADAEVVVDLNGNDIIGTTTASGASQVLFEVKGELTVVGDGTIALYDKSGATFNEGYENAAIYVNGGVANLNEGTIVSISDGEAMAYAADAVGGNSVINVNGATLYSSYIGVRSFPTVSGKTNTVNYNSGVVYGGKNGYDIWTQEGNGSTVVNIADGIVYTYEDQWGGMYYIADDADYVSTSEGLNAALANGGEIVLMPGEYEAIDLYSLKDSDGVTIVGIEGATVGKVVNTSPKSATITNLTFKNITFTAQVSTNNCKVNGITFDGCDFINGGWLLLTGYTKTPEINATVQNCTFIADSVGKALSVQNASKNVTIKNNTFTNCYGVAIHADTISGDYLIEGNIINSTGSTAIRFGTQDGANITIKDNTITKCASAEVVKITGAVLDVTASGNTHNGAAITFNGGIAK